jgi:phosphoribosylaminoimidazolecarboxamide formyltransferase/IMP cyclohydrolase
LGTTNRDITFYYLFSFKTNNLNNRITIQGTGIFVVEIKRAIISVSDKTGVVDLARGLEELGVEIISTGGTLKTLVESGVNAKAIEEVTSFPEMMDGRVKTLHPKVHGGILARRDIDEHLSKAKEHDIGLIDMVVVNLYPFEKTVKDPNSTLEDIIENIDIGGPTLVRSAAKNHASVAIVTEPGQYPAILDELREAGGLSEGTLKRLAVQAFAQTSRYDTSIFNHLCKHYCEDVKLTSHIRMAYEKVQDCRYGENPYNAGAFYEDPMAEGIAIPRFEQLHGKELSFNNFMDIDAATNIVMEFTEPAVAIVKHTNPCGAATGATLVEAFKAAHECDTDSAFGSIIALNRVCDMDTAKEIDSFFTEVIIAPDYEPEVLELFKKKKNRRILKTDLDLAGQEYTGNRFKMVKGGLLVQSSEHPNITTDDLQAVTEVQPTDEQVEAMLFGIKIARHIKSNTILLVKGTSTVGVGAGQMSRLDAAHMAIHKAGEKAHGSIVISDAFFPFRDGLDTCVEAGAVAVIQPGGSMRDQEVIDAANEHKIPMVFMGKRLFNH